MAKTKRNISKDIKKKAAPKNRFKKEKGILPLTKEREHLKHWTNNEIL